MSELKIKIKEYLQAQNWQRIGVMLFVGVFAVFVAIYFSYDSPNSALLPTDKALPTNNKVNIAAKNTAKPNSSSEESTSDVALKDPFKIPEKFKVLPPPTIKTTGPATGTGTANASNKTIVNPKDLPKLKLTGIVGTGASREAIVEVSGKSRSYKKMAIIIDSPYQLIYMTDKSAVFRDSSGEKTTLTVGR